MEQADFHAGKLNRVVVKMLMRKLLLSALFIAVLAAGIRWAMDFIWPSKIFSAGRPALSAMSPLKQNVGSAIAAVPISVPLSEIRANLNARAPHVFTGMRESPLPVTSSKTYIGWRIERGSLSLSGHPNELTLSTKYSGTFHLTDSATGHSENALGGITGSTPKAGNTGQDPLTGMFDQQGAIGGRVVVTAHPVLLPNWRFEPNLKGEISVAPGGFSIAGFNIDVPNEVRPFIDRAVAGQIKLLDARIRENPDLEQLARQGWANLCRSISITPTTGAPDFWLELRPTRAFATQPVIDANELSLTLGVEAETRILPTSTSPECPFPTEFQIVPSIDHGQVFVTSPIDIPFTEISRILDLELKGRKFPDQPDATVDFTVLRASVAPSDDRLLITLFGKVKENKSWFGMNADATVSIWVRPVLDHIQQTLKLTDITLDVESEAALGLVGVAARTIVSSLKETLEKNAVIDLKPYAANASSNIVATVSEFHRQQNNVRADASVTSLLLLGIEFDAKILRLFAEAKGAVSVAVTKFPTQLRQAP